MRLPLAAYDTGAGASDPKTNKQTRQKPDIFKCHECQPGLVLQIGGNVGTMTHNSTTYLKYSLKGQTQLCLSFQTVVDMTDSLNDV